VNVAAFLLAERPVVFLLLLCDKNRKDCYIFSSSFSLFTNSTDKQLKTIFESAADIKLSLNIKLDCDADRKIRELFMTIRPHFCPF
jgi:hypothetical protein